MISKEEVLNRALDYDFSAVKEYLDLGGSIDIYDGYGRGLLASLMCGYYMHAYYIGPDGKKIDTEAEEIRNAIYYSWTRLEDRPHAIKQEIDYLLAKGINVNAIGWEEAKEYQKSDTDFDVETPLYFTVKNRDYFMTKYLLEHGADPDIKFSFEEDDMFDDEHWLLTDLDIAILNGDLEEAMENDVKIAALLMHYGKGEWEGGYCIKVDHKNRTIQSHSSIIKY